MAHKILKMKEVKLLSPDISFFQETIFYTPPAIFKQNSLMEVLESTLN